MKRTTGAVGLGLGVVVLAVAAPAEQRPAARGPNTAKIADTLVNSCANLRFDDLVMITGGSQDQQLLEDVAIEVRKLGAHPMIDLKSDRLDLKFYTDVAARFDSQSPNLALKVAESIDALISIDYSQRPDLLAKVQADRIADSAKAFAPVSRRLLDRGVVQVHLGNGLYPTQARARQFGITESELAQIFWDGVNVDYKMLQNIGERVKSMLAAGRETRITAPNGTDLTVEIARRPVFVSDGVISSEERYTGGPACQAWLPAGEVFLAPVKGTAKGTFVADTFFFEGQRIEGLTMKFSQGKMTSLTAKSDIKMLRERYDAAPTGRDMFAAIDIGINPNVKAPRGSKMVTWVASGTVSLGIGNNHWAGGENEVPFDLFAHLTKATLTVDGRKIVENGRLMIDR